MGSVLILFILQFIYIIYFNKTGFLIHLYVSLMIHLEDTLLKRKCTDILLPVSGTLLMPLCM